MPEENKKNKRGIYCYVPPIVLDELKDIRREDRLDGAERARWRTEAFFRLVGYARQGREVQRLMRLDFSRSVPQPPLSSYPQKKYKKVKPKNMFDF
jgi:hypothetical protein